jgi:hypothetical protein
MVQQISNNLWKVQRFIWCALYHVVHAIVSAFGLGGLALPAAGVFVGHVVGGGFANSGGVVVDVGAAVVAAGSLGACSEGP